MPKPRILVFASGTKDGGGSGFRELVENTQTGVLQAKIVGVVSNCENGGVRRIADSYGVPFRHMPPPREAANYQALVTEFEAEWISLSGWLKFVIGLDPAKTFNIHPGPLPGFGGKGYYGHRVHEAIMEAFQNGYLKESAVTMHFVDERYDHGPIFFRFPVRIREEDTPETFGARVNKIEHAWQSWVTNLVVTKQIRLENGKVIIPDWYPFL